VRRSVSLGGGIGLRHAGTGERLLLNDRARLSFVTQRWVLRDRGQELFSLIVDLRVFVSQPLLFIVDQRVLVGQLASFCCRRQLFVGQPRLLFVDGQVLVSRPRLFIVDPVSYTHLEARPTNQFITSSHRALIRSDASRARPSALEQCVLGGP